MMLAFMSLPNDIMAFEILPFVHPHLSLRLRAASTQILASVTRGAPFGMLEQIAERPSTSRDPSLAVPITVVIRADPVKLWGRLVSLGLEPPAWLRSEGAGRRAAVGQR